MPEAKVITLPERVTVEKVEEFRNQVMKEIEEPCDIKLSAEHVVHLDSAGIQLLVSIFKTLSMEKRKLSVINSSIQFREIMRISGLNAILHFEEE